MRISTCENLFTYYEEFNNKNKLIKHIEENDFLNLFDKDISKNMGNEYYQLCINLIDKVYSNLEEYLNICNFTIENYHTSNEYLGIIRETIVEVTTHKEKIEKYLLKVKIEKDFKRIEKEGQLGKFIRENGNYNEPYDTNEYIYKNVFFSLTKDGDLFIKEDGEHSPLILVDCLLTDIKTIANTLKYSKNQEIVNTAKELLQIIQLRDKIDKNLELKINNTGKNKI